MALTSFVQTSFLGGEISQAAQGRMDDPAYKTSLNVCFNAIPVEPGIWMRRPGTRFVAPTRGGRPGKLIPFAFTQNYPYVMEFTDGVLRFTTGPALVVTNDGQTVLGISADTPAIVQTQGPHGWTTGNTVIFDAQGVMPLDNRQFVITVLNALLFTIADAITNAPIDGSIIGTFTGGGVVRVLEIGSGFGGSSWANLRSVQAETRTALLNGTHPQILQVATPPSPTRFPTFSYGAADFLDGPYLDPIPNSYITSSALNGVVSLTLSFAAYDATRAYNIGDFVSAGGISYKSLTALNAGNAPAGSPGNWAPVNAGSAVNGGLGFVASDIGRLVRLFSEPALWAAASTYVAKDIVAYPDGLGGNSYWTATGAVAAGIQPGTSTLWALNATGAIWTWAQITGVSGSGLIAPVTAIGNLTGGGGLAAAFDSNTSKGFSGAANYSLAIATYPVWSAVTWTAGTICQYAGIAYTAQAVIYTNYTAASPWSSSATYQGGNQAIYQDFVWQSDIANNKGQVPGAVAGAWEKVIALSSDPPPTRPDLWLNVGAMASPSADLYVGQQYGVASAIQSATLWPTSDIGFENSPNGAVLIVNLRAKASAPGSPSDGTLLASSGPIGNLFSPLTLTSGDQVTTWSDVWFEIIASWSQSLPDDGSHNFTAKVGVSQAQFYTPNVNNGSVITAQIRGPALLYAQTIRTWRAGLYSETTGWPTCGVYHEGRTWYGGVVKNRFDAGVSDGFVGTQLDFAPTTPSGQVVASSAISYTCTGEDANDILWMVSDQQGILFGTKAGEWLISAPTAGPLAANNIRAVRVTKVGCANTEPRRAEHTWLLVQKFGRKIVEYFPEVYSGKYTAPSLTERAKHLTVKGIAEIAYQQELAPLIWMRRNDGALIGATYKRDTLTTSQGPNIIGHHRHELGSGRVVESICVGPSAGGNLDTLSMITNDTNTGIRHIELMSDLLDEGFALRDCWFLDDAIVPSKTVVLDPPHGGPYGSLSVYGLSPHNGRTVTAFVAGIDCGDYLVQNGFIGIPFGDGVSGGTGNGLFTAALVQSFVTLPAVIGFSYNSDGQLVRPVTQADSGAQAGPGFAKTGRQHMGAMQLYGAVNGSIAFGTDFDKLDPIRLRYPNDVPYTVQQQWSGIWRDRINSTLDFDGRLAWRISRPLPGFVIAVGGFDSKADT